MRVSLLVAVLGCATLARAHEIGGLFEQVGQDPSVAWRTRGVSPELLVLTDGFVIRHGNVLQRFRWQRSMRLNSLVAEEPVVSHSYQLSGPVGDGRLLPHAMRIRAVSRDRKIAVAYYFGKRGLEVDIQVEPGARVSRVGLESRDADLSLGGTGQLEAGGHSLWMQPVAYGLDARGGRHATSAGYRLSNRRHLLFEVGRYDPADRLVIDPVLTYATYYGGSGDESPIAFREMPDGSVLMAGNTTSIDLPGGVSLNTSLLTPSGAIPGAQCFVANISPAKKEINFVSYFGGSGTSCYAMDLDSSGRILLFGQTAGSPTLTTPGAQYPTTKYQRDGFIARISADGRTLEYSTYLGLDFNTAFMFMRAGPGETAYLVIPCDPSGVVGAPNVPGGYQQAAGPALLLRYNIAAKAFDQQTYFVVAPSGMEVSPSGTVYIFGNNTNSYTKLPLQKPVQTQPLTNSAGFVSEFSADFRTLLFSSYLGGQNAAAASITSMLANADGSLWLTGLAGNGSIPGLQPVRPPVAFDSVFAVRVMPGRLDFISSFFAGDGYGRGSPVDFVQLTRLADARICLSAALDPSKATPGAAILGPGAPPGLMFGCLNDKGSDFEMLTSAGSELVTPSKSGGIWSLLAGSSFGAFQDAVPFDFKSAAIQPFSANGFTARGANADLVLYYIDLTTPKPVLINPRQLHLTALPSYFTDSVDLVGRNFAVGMQLEVDGQQAPLATSFPTASTLSYVSASGASPGKTVLGLHAGTYTGQLTIPTQPQAIASAAFPVVVSNLAPQPQPFVSTLDRLTFNVLPPLYDDSIVLWNGHSLPIRYATDGIASVQIPAELATGPTGEFVLTNQRPGGGVERQSVSLIPAGSIQQRAQQPVTRISADFFQVDRSRQILYAITITDKDHWTLSSYSLPSARLLHSVPVAKKGATIEVDFKLSIDGSWLYLTDDTFRIMRFRTDSLRMDLQFQLTTDLPPPLPGSVQRVFQSLQVLDEPESLLVVTPAGRMIIYDRDQPRPYTTTDFPSPYITAMDPVLVTGSYVYALQRPPVFFGFDYPPTIACLVRYPVDGLGFGPAENFCNPGVNWGKYPEMKIYDGNLVLQNDREAHGIRLAPDNFGVMRLPLEYDLRRKMIINPFFIFVPAPAFRLLFSRIDDGQPIGHYPSQSVLGQAIVSALILDDDTLIYFQQITQLATGQSGVYVVPKWQSASEIYP